MLVRLREVDRDPHDGVAGDGLHLDIREARGVPLVGRDQVLIGVSVRVRVRVGVRVGVAVGVGVGVRVGVRGLGVTLYLPRPLPLTWCEGLMMHSRPIT